MLGCSATARDAPASGSGSGGRRMSSGSSNSQESCQRGRRNRTSVSAVAIIAKTKERPCTPVSGARRIGTLMSVPALPRVTH